MKHSFAVLLILSAIISSCNTPPAKSWLNEDNLPLQEYTIDITRDTVLVTKNGALLQIPTGALRSDKGKTVVLEIKEAYSMQQIIQGGMVTQSNGEPLSSAGMIYINAKAGQDVKITRAINVATPSNYLNDSMQLYKGQKDENGNINWEEPTALPENMLMTKIKEGKLLFQSKCTFCHMIGKNVTAPNLAHFPKRFSDEEGALRRTHFHFQHHYPSCYGSDAADLYAWELRAMYGSMGPLFPEFDDNHDLDKIYSYIQNESDKNNLPLPDHAYLKDCVDSCCRYTEMVFNLQKKKQEINSSKEKLIRDNGKMVEESQQQTPQLITEDNEPGPVIQPPADKVSPREYNASYYQFSIETFGWFNIDILLTGVDGVEESELFVRITGEYREKVQVYLIIPSVKVYVEGGPAERNEKEFAFYLKNGKISLPQNEKAYILALTETEQSIAFSIKEFTTSLKQEFDIALTASTKEKFTAAINSLSLDGININVKDAKNANKIRKMNPEVKDIDQQLKEFEYLKPKNCNCDGSQPVPGTGHLAPSGNYYY